MKHFLLSIVLLSCAGRLDDPERFTNAALVYDCAPGIDVERDILAQKCGSCHGSLESEAGLDLISPGVGERLYGVASTTCEGEVLIDYDNVFSGFFYDKLSSQTPRCGVAMPFGEDLLTEAELDCLHLWLASQHPEDT